MNKKTLVTTGLILTLLGSNIVLAEKYVLNKNILENKMYSQAMEIDTYKSNIVGLKKMLKTQESEKDKFLNLAIKSNQQLNKVKNENTSLKKEVTKLKKELVERKEANKRRQLKMTLTFYGADCSGCSGITKTGIRVKNTIYYKGMRVIATDPSVIKLHSIVKIETDKESYIAYAADTGSAIKGNILDVLVSSEQESIKHGRQQATVTIIREGRG